MAEDTARHPLDDSTVTPIRHTDFRVWFLAPYDLFHAMLPHPEIRAAVSLLLGLAEYLIGLAIAAAGNIVDLYLSTVPIYLLCASFIFYMGRARWLQLTIIARAIAVREAFLVDSATYYSAARQVGRRGTSLVVMLGSALVGLAVAWAALAVIYWQPASWLGRLLGRLEPSTFGAVWFSAPHALAKMLVLGWYLTCAMLFTLPVVCGTVIIVAQLPGRFGRWPVVPIPAYVIARLRPVADFFLIGALYYALAVLALVLIYGGSPTLALVGTVTVFAAVGLLCVLIPPLAIQRLVLRARDQVATAVASEYLRHLYPTAATTASAGGEPRAGQATSDYAELLRLQEIMQAANLTGGWVYQTQTLVAGILSQGIPFLGFLISRFVRL